VGSVMCIRDWSIAVLVAFLSACASVPLPIPRLREDAEPAPELARKLVIAKEPPTELIAEDGTRCLTTESRFKRTRVGFEAWCVWTGAGGHFRP
jgi:hypothetical protein